MISNLLRRFVDDRSGATALDYGLIIALVLVGLVGALHAL